MVANSPSTQVPCPKSTALAPLASPPSPPRTHSPHTELSFLYTKTTLTSLILLLGTIHICIYIHIHIYTYIYMYCICVCFQLALIPRFIPLLFCHPYCASPCISHLHIYYSTGGLQLYSYTVSLVQWVNLGEQRFASRGCTHAYNGTGFPC
jgi:hypothetical protein